MNNPARTILMLTATLFLSGCDSAIVTEARKAEREGRIIENEIMSELYPGTYYPGEPPYLERDFEAGADFICDVIKRKRKEDVCSDSDINWR